MKLLLEKGNLTFSNKFRKLYQYIIQYKLKTRDPSRQFFGTNVYDSNSVIFGVKIDVFYIKEE